VSKASPVLLLTRPRAQSKSFLRACEDAAGRRIDAVVAPILQIVPLGAKVNLTGLGGVIFTSANAVAAIGDTPRAAGLRAWCVGEQTARAAKAAGFDAVAADGDAEALVSLILRNQPPGPLLHLCGVHQASDIAGQLAEAGVPTRTQAVYDQVARPLPAEALGLLEGAGRPVILPLFSPRSARLIRDAVPRIGEAVIPLAISDNVARAWGGDPERLSVARSPDAGAMVALVVAAMGKDSAC
jgi:uroporphyrinogen-III synthase